MRLVTYRPHVDAAARLGVLHGPNVVDVHKLAASAGVHLPDNMLDFIGLGPAAVAQTSSLLHGLQPHALCGIALPAANVRLLAPIPRPRKNVFGIGMNYVRHIEEMNRALGARAMPTQPVIFSKPPTSVIGPGEAIEHNRQLTQQMDWEVELAVIIGPGGKGIAEADAMTHVFGYSVMVDISARDCRRAGQWIYSKGQDTYGPFGPWIVTADEIGDPHSLNLSLRVNGVMKQNSNTSDLLFKVPRLIADISAGMTLEPGDIIATGTPEGVGAGLTPQEWLWPGDVVEAYVEGIGTLRNPVVAV